MAVHHRGHERGVAACAPGGSRAVQRDDVGTTPMARRILLLASLFLVSALYFSLGINTTMDLVDQGQIVYPSWRVSEGALPYGNFRHLYGPSIFFFNGMVFRLFGPDLWVLHCCLVLLKSLVVIFVFVAARRIGRTTAALMVAAFLVIVWGSPFLIFNTPYASYYAIPLILAGMLFFIVNRSRLKLSSTIAGLCFGLAMTFKQTSGVFAAVAFAWSMLHHRLEAVPGVGSRWRLASSVRLLTIAAPLGVFAVYLWAHLDLWTDLVLSLPALFTCVWLARREIDRPPSADDDRYAFSGIVSCAVGLLYPIVVYGVFFQYHGILNRVVHDTLIGLPQKMAWFTPFPRPGLLTVLLLLTGATFFVAIRLAFSRKADPPYRWCFPVAAMILVVAGAALAWQLIRHTPTLSEVAVRLLFSLPVLVVWATLAAVLRRDPVDATDSSRAATESGLVLFGCYGVVSLLHFFPAADVWHVLMTLPVFLILLARPLAGLLRCGARGPTLTPGVGLAGGVAALLLAVVLAVPFVQALVFTRTALPDLHVGFERASGVFDPSPKFGEAVALVDYLREPAQRERRLLVLVNEQMIYFLAGKPSILEDHEFLLYLVGADLIEATDARRAADEQKLVRRVEAGLPLVVDDSDSGSGARLRQVFPALGAFLDRCGHPVATFGSYEVLDCRGGATDGSNDGSL
jgi:hypothetical protein